MSNEQYRYWFQELENPNSNERDTNRTDLAGFWRIKGAKTKWDMPLAIWPEGEASSAVITPDGSYLVARLANNKSTWEEGSKGWWSLLTGFWLSAIACTEDDYRIAMATDMWPDGKAAKETAVVAPEPEKEAEPTPAPVHVENLPKQERDVGIGHNMPPMGSEYAKRLKAEVDLLKELTAKPVEDEETAEKIGECKNRIGIIKREAKAEHEIKKAPHRKAGKIVDDAFNPTIKACDVQSRKAGIALQPFIDAKQEKLNEAAEKERIKKQAESDRQAREKAELAGDDPAQAEGKVIKTKKQSASVGKAAGRSVHTTTITFAEITDFAKLLDALKDREEIKELVQSLANRAAKSGVELPGMEIKTEKKVV